MDSVGYCVNIIVEWILAVTRCSCMQLSDLTTIRHVVNLRALVHIYCVCNNRRCMYLVLGVT